MELEKIAAMPFNATAVRVKQFDASLSEAGKFKSHDDALRYFSVTLLSVCKNPLCRETQWGIQRQLFEQAIRVQRDEVDAVQPIHGKKGKYRKTETGFELQYSSTSDPIVIKVGC